MVTNLPEEVKALWSRAIVTKNPRMKLELLRQMYSKLPKHKGTANLVVSLRRQISNLESLLEEQERKAKKRGSGGIGWTVKKPEFPQLSVVGPLERSMALFSKLTGLKPEVYRLYETPIVGIFDSADIHLQIIWAPIDDVIGRWLLNRVSGVIINSDILLLAASSRAELESTIERLGELGVILSSKDIGVDVKVTSNGGIIVTGTSSNVSHEEVRDYLRSLGVRNAMVRLRGESKLEDLEATLLGKKVKRCIVVSSKGDRLSTELPSIRSDRLDDLGHVVLRILGLTRIYTKPPGKDVQRPPLLLVHGSTVRDVAENVHRELLETFRFARIWRVGHVLRVGLDFVVEDGDIVEIRG